MPNQGWPPFSVEEAAGIVDHPNGTLDWAPVLEDEEAPTEAAPAQEESWPEPNLTKAGIEDATDAWSGIHYADIRQYMMTGRVREGMSLADDAIHGISEARAAQSVSTLSKLIAEGPGAPTLYRGLNVSDDVLAKFSALRTGERLDMALSSWSADAAEAAKFATRTTSETRHAVVLQATDAQGFNMAKYSFYPQEKEWITHGRFVVDSVKQVDDQLIVTLRQEAVWTAPRSGIQ